MRLSGSVPGWSCLERSLNGMGCRAQSSCMPPLSRSAALQRYLWTQKNIFGAWRTHLLAFRCGCFWPVTSSSLPSLPVLPYVCSWYGEVARSCAMHLARLRRSGAISPDTRGAGRSRPRCREQPAISRCGSAPAKGTVQAPRHTAGDGQWRCYLLRTRCLAQTHTASPLRHAYPSSFRYEAAGTLARYEIEIRDKFRAIRY